MKIFALQNIYPQTNQVKQNFKKEILRCSDVQQSELQSFITPINFKSNSVAYLKAKEYLAKEFPKIKERDLFRYDLKKLNGIQEGIKVFKGMTMAEIAFVLTTVSEFATVRGCRNNCLHCYADAKPPIKEDISHTNKMLWEDFVSLTDGIKELNNRLGFKASCRTWVDSDIDSDRYLTAFHDSDSLDVVLKDKLGNEHDFIEIADRLYDSMGIKVIFDTAGWNLSDKKAQERAEKYVKCFSDDSFKLDDINISFNPFHSLHTREIALRKEGKDELADKMHKLYIDRMANALFTFTPLAINEKFNVLACALPDDKVFEGFTIVDTIDLFQETLERLRELYQKDFEGEQKYITSKSNIENYIKVYDGNLAARYISFLEKARDYFGVDNYVADESSDKILGTMQNLATVPDSIDKYRTHFVGIIDSNGDYYMTNYNLTLPTEIKLNFDNKRETAPIKPYLKDNFLIKRTDVNNFPIKV